MSVSLTCSLNDIDSARCWKKYIMLALFKAKGMGLYIFLPRIMTKNSHYCESMGNVDPMKVCSLLGG